MLKRYNVKDILVFFLIGSLYAWSLNANIISTTVLDVHFFDVFIITLFFLFCFFVICYNKITLCISLGILTFIFLYLLYYAFFAEGLPAHLEDLYEYSHRLSMFVRGYDLAGQDFSYAIIAIIAALITLYTTIFMFVSFNFLMLTVLGLMLFGISWIAGYKSIDGIYITFLFTFLVLLVKRLNDPKSGRLNGQFTMPVIPFCLVLIFAAWSIPIPEDREPLDIYSLSETIQKPYNFINDVVYEAFNPKYFSMQTSGFTDEDGRLGGEVSLNSRYVMSVYADEKVYLTGAIKDTYTGHSWTNSNPEYYAADIDDYGDPDLYDYLYETDLLNATDEELYFSVKNVTIDTGESRTGTVFRPLGTLMLQLQGDYDIMVNEHGDIRTNRLIRQNTRYRMYYLDIDHDIPEILRRSGDAVENKNLTQLPKTIPERVYTLTESITYGYNDNYSKIKRIESFLNTYSYNLSPETPPYGSDFVDYFLFDGQEGYCTYYASAMVVMSRIVGMPARYVEGYIMPDRKNENGAYIVTNLQAHAWPEIYFEDFGWMPFEPTAPFTATFYENETRSVTTYGDIVFTQEEYAYYEEMGLTSMLEIPSQDGVMSTEESDVKKLSATILRIAILPSLIIIGLALVSFVNATRHKIFDLRLQKLKGSERACEYFKKILQIAAIMGYSIYENETVKNYSQRVGKSFAFGNEKYFISDLADIFSKAKYGNKEITEDEDEFISAAYEEMLDKVRNRLNTYRYFFYRYVLYKF